jgi:hypothetical protein
VGNRVFLNKQFSNYLGENRAILDIYSNFLSGATPTPTPTPSATQIPVTPSFTPSPTPLGLFCVGQGFDTRPAAVLYSGGSIFVGGTFQFYQGNPLKLIAKINSTTGNADGSFFQQSITNISPNSGVQCFAPLSGGSLLVGGSFTYQSNTTRMQRFFADGRVDTSFLASINGNVADIEVAPDESYYMIGGTFVTTPANRIAKLLPDGSVDTTFTAGTGFNAQVFCMAQDGSGNYFVGGQFASYKGTTRNRLLKIDAFGNVDATFATGLGTGFNGNVTDIIYDSGFIYCVGLFTTYNGTSTSRIAKINATTGVLDATFTSNIGTGLTSTGTISEVNILLNPTNNNLYITCQKSVDTGVESFNGTTFYGKIFAISKTGIFDTNFGSQTNVDYGFDYTFTIDNNSAEIGAVLPNGDMVFVGDFTSFNGQLSQGIVKIDMSGNPLSTSNCYVPPLTPTPTPTPSTSPLPLLSFVVASGATAVDACTELALANTFTVYADDLGNCGPCLPNTCWACLTTGQLVYSDINGTIPVGDGYYANNMDGMGNNASWYIVGGFPQGAGFAGC